MLADLQVGALTRVLRPTMLVAVAFGVVGVAVALLLNEPFAALGLAVGIGLGILNLRMLAAGVVKVEIEGEQNGKIIKRILRTRSALRLVALTVIAIGAVLISPPLGMGVVIGLVIFQLSFVINAGRAVLREGIS